MLESRSLSHFPGCVVWLPGAEGTPRSQLILLLCQLTDVIEPHVQGDTGMSEWLILRSGQSPGIPDSSHHTLTLVTAAIGLPATCRFEGHCSVRGFATTASTGKNRGAAVVLLLPSRCGASFWFSKVPSARAHSRGSVWNRGRPGVRWVWSGAAELYLPEYLDTAATPVGVTSGRHKNQS